MDLLKGIRVLDFGRYIAAPYCASLLGQMGAEVIRIERPGGNEDRFLIPVTEQGDGALYLQMNTNKLGMTLNISKEKGKVIMSQLIATADIVIANMPPRTMKSLGLDYENLKKIKPDIILVANTAFGRKGAFANRIGFDSMAQAMSGSNHFSGMPGQPTRCATNYVDFSTALSAALGTLAAIMHKQRTGQGQVVETSLLATSLTLFNSMLMEQATMRTNRRPTGNRSQTVGPSDLFRTKNGHIIVSVVGKFMFKRWTQLINKPELLDDERFKDDLSRGDHNDYLCSLMQEWCSQRSTEEALAELEQAKLPAGPVRSLQETLDDPMVKSLDHLVPLAHPGSKVDPPIAKASFQLSKSPLKNQKRAPLLGEHTQQILLELGYDLQQQRDLKTLGVI